MSIPAKAAPCTVSATLLLLLAFAPQAMAQGKAPSFQTCQDLVNPPRDVVTQGGCAAITRTKGNCQACHMIAGIASGNVAPPLLAIPARFPDKARLRAQVWDATVANPRTSMPPFGRHGIMTPDEVDRVVEWLLTL